MDFIGYLSVGSLPTVYPLYSPMEDFYVLRQQLCIIGYIRTPVLHASPFLTPRNDVLCYILVLDFSAPPLDLPFLMAMTCENGVHGLYQYVDETDLDGRTVVHIARYPTGYQKIPNSDLAEFSDIFSISGQGTSIIPPQSWIGSESAYINLAGPSSAVGLHQQAVAPANPPAKRAVGCGLHRIMTALLWWHGKPPRARLPTRSKTTGNRRPLAP